MSASQRIEVAAGPPLAVRIEVAAGRRLAVRVDGSGPPLLVLHGFTGSAETMAGTAEQLQGFRRIRVDLLGHGGSDAPEWAAFPAAG